MRGHKRIHHGLLLLTMLMAGCMRDTAWHDAREASDPMMRRAAARAAEGDTDYAIELYRKVLDQDARLGRAHLDMALLLHDVKADYVRALYHYQRYLELRPQTEKRTLVENRIRLARQSFVAQLAPQSAEIAVQRELARLRKAHDELQARYASLEHELAMQKQRQAATAGAVLPSTPMTHTVQPGENLTHIAQRYGVSLADMVTLNNLKNANAIRAGQVLRVPAVDVD